MSRIHTTAIIAALLLAASPASAEEAKREGFKELVAALAASVQKATGDRPVRVGYFTPVGNDHSNAGGAFMAAVAQQLAKVQADARLELKGEFQLIDDPKAPGLKLLRVDAALKDLDFGGNFKEFTPYEGPIRAAADLAAILVLPVAFKPDKEYGEAPDAGRNRDLQKRLPPGPGKPPAVTAVLAGTLVRAAAGSKYDIEIQAGPAVNGAFAGLTARLDDGAYPGLPVVEIGAGQYYRVRVVNRDSVEVAVGLQLDGIDQFTFSEDRAKSGSPRFTSWVVGPGEEVVIKGWHRCVGDAARPGAVFGFLTTQAGQGAAGQFPTLSQGKVGTIGVSVAYTKPAGTKGPGLETAVGAPVEVKQTAVERKVAAPHEFVAVRYSC